MGGPRLSGVDLLRSVFHALEEYANYFYDVSKNWSKPPPEAYDFEDVAHYFSVSSHVVALILEVFSSLVSIMISIITSGFTKFVQINTKEVMDYETSTYKLERVLKETVLTLGIVIFYISAVVLLLHVFSSGPLRLKLGWGIIGATITLTVSLWVIIFAQLLYIVITKLEEAWSGFTCLTFVDLFGLVKLNLASTVILYFEFRYLMIMVIITSRLTNLLVPIDATSSFLNINAWDVMLAREFPAAIRMRKSKELGSGNFPVARFSVTVVSMTSVTIGVVTMILASNGVTYCYSLQYNHMAISIVSFLCPKQWCHSCGDELRMQYFLAYTCNHEYGRLVVKGNYYPICLKDQLNAESTPWGCCVIFQLLLPCQGGKISKEKYTQFPSRKDTTIKDKSGMANDDALLRKADVNRMLWTHIDIVVLLSRKIEGVAIALAITFISLYICVIAPADIWDLLNTLTPFACSGGMLWAYIFVYPMSRRQSPSRRVIMKGNFWIPQVLIKWSIWYATEATWENEDKLKLSNPSSNLEDKVVFKGEGNVMRPNVREDTLEADSGQMDNFTNAEQVEMRRSKRIRGPHPMWEKFVST